MARQVLIVAGDEADSQALRGAGDALDALAVGYEVRLLADMRLTTPPGDDGERFGVIVAGAATHPTLAAELASQSPLPVVAVPLESAEVRGVAALRAVIDAATSTPFATVALGGAHNAGLLAAQMLAMSDEALYERLAAYKQQLATMVREKDDALQRLGVAAYLERQQH